MGIRKARPGDGRRIEEIRVAGWHAAYADLLDPDWLAELTVTDERVQTWEQRLATPEPGTGYLVADDGERVVGFAAVMPSRDQDVPGAAELAALYVEPSERRTGIGSALITAVFERRTEPVHLLWVLAGNEPGRRFYERHGFAVDGAHKTLDVAGRPDEVRYRRPA